MKIVSTRDEREITEWRCRKEVEWALRDLTANLLRVTRGAGRGHDIWEQALRFLQSCKAYHDQVGVSPDHRFSQMLNAPKFDATDGERAHHKIICGALQITASRLLGQLMPERAGEQELEEGIRNLRLVRDAHRRALLGRTAISDGLSNDDGGEPNPFDVLLNTRP
jgi:hypothetical protein